MKRFISFKLSLILLFTALSTLAPVTSVKAQGQSTCENGECIDGLIDRLQDLGSVYQDECLPSEGLKADLEEYHEENGLTEKCWQLITEINHLESELQKHQTRLEERLGCQSGNCNLPNQEESLNTQLTALTKVEQNLSCTIPKKKEIQKQCPQDLNCVMAATLAGNPLTLGLGGYAAEKLLPKNSKLKDCHLGNDGCFVQLATGFARAAITFFEGAWGLLKMAGNAAKKKMGQFWNWVSGAEDHSSTSQLAMAKASEDPGVFDMLLKDFPGTMSKLWSALVASLKEWMKTDIFCQKWQGVPRFSQCLKPLESFDCIPCKTLVNGMCAISGTIVAEVVPAFLTGGLVTAAKHGANGAVKIAKLFKVSEKSARAIKNSRVGRIAIEATNKVDDTLKISRGIRATKAVVEAALQGIRKYLLSPGRKVMKESFSVLSKAVKKGTAFVAESPVGKYLVISGKSAKLTGRVLIYPIDNPLTVFAFRAGQRSFDKAFTLGAPRLGAKGAVASTLIDNEKGLELILAKIEEAKIKPSKSKDLVKLEEELLAKIGPKRKELLREALDKENVQFSEIISNLYPELKYGDLAKKLSPEKILAAEKELYLAIEAMSDGPAKTALIKKYQAHVAQGEARAEIVGDNSPAYKSVD